MIFWALKGDLSFKTLEQTMHDCTSGEGILVIDAELLNEPKSLWEVEPTSWEKVRMDHPSEELLEREWRGSGEREMLERELKDDFREGMRLSETCL